MTIAKKRRAVSRVEPRYPDGQVGRRRFLRELGFGAAAAAALPLMACVADNDAQGAPSTDWRVADHGGVAPPLDAAIDQTPTDLQQGQEHTVVDCLFPSEDARSDGTTADAAERPDGGIPDGAGPDVDTP